MGGMSEHSGVPTELSSQLRELAWAIHRHAPARAGVGPVPTTEVALLKQVVDSPGCTVGELAATLGLRQPNVSAALRPLVHRQWVRKEPDPLDRRVTRIFPTDLGAYEHLEISEAWRRPVAHAIETLSPTMRAALEAAREALAAVQAAVRDAAESSATRD